MSQETFGNLNMNAEDIDLRVSRNEEKQFNKRFDSENLRSELDTINRDDHLFSSNQRDQNYRSNSLQRQDVSKHSNSRSRSGVNLNDLLPGDDNNFNVKLNKNDQNYEILDPDENTFKTAIESKEKINPLDLDNLNEHDDELGPDD